MASKATELQTQIAKEMNAIAERRRYLESIVTEMDARKKEVDHAMEDHVKRLHDNIDARYQRAKKVFHDEQEKYWSNILQETLQLDNVSSQLASLQMKEEETLAKVPARRRSRAQGGSPLHNELHAILGKLPSQQVFHAPFYSIEVPQNADEVVSSLVGCFRISVKGEVERSASAPISNMTKQRIVRGYVGEAEVTVKGTKTVVSKAEARLTETTAPVKEAERSIPPLNPPGGKQAKKKRKKRSKRSRKSHLQEPTPPTVEEDDSDWESENELLSSFEPEGEQLPFEPGVKPHSFDLLTDMRPTIITGRCKEPSAMAVRPDGNVWLVYRDRDPCLDLVDEHGHIVQTFHVGGNATGVAALGDTTVIFVSQIGLTFRFFLLEQASNRIVNVKLEVNPTSVALGLWACVVSSKRSLLWLDFFGGVIKTHCIVPNTKNSHLLKVCDTEVALCQGKQLVCAADTSGHAVYFYRVEDGPDFLPLAPYKGENISRKYQAAFTPISLSFHPRGFLGILDKTSESVVLLAMDGLGAGPPLCTITKSMLCDDGVPTVIALGPGVSGDRPRLWVASSSGFLCHTSLRLL